MTDTANFLAPGSGGGLLDVFHRRYLLRLLVHKELKARYHGSVLGMLWSYIKPAVQFGVFYFVIGVFFKMNYAVENYAVYLFSGIVAMNFFSEAFGNATRSITGNWALVKKIYLPRELFPVASVFVSFIHFIPQVLVLLVGCFVTGWHPSGWQLLAGVGAFFVLAVFALGVGLIFGALNVVFRDFENVVDLILMVATWASPVIYTWTAARTPSAMVPCGGSTNATPSPPSWRSSTGLSGPRRQAARPRCPRRPGPSSSSPQESPWRSWRSVSSSSVVSTADLRRNSR